MRGGGRVSGRSRRLLLHFLPERARLCELQASPGQERALGRAGTLCSLGQGPRSLQGAPGRLQGGQGPGLGWSRGPRSSFPPSPRRASGRGPSSGQSWQDPDAPSCPDPAKSSHWEGERRWAEGLSVAVVPCPGPQPTAMPSARPPALELERSPWPRAALLGVGPAPCLAR